MTALKLGVALVEKTKSMQVVDAKLLGIPVPGCENHKYKSDAYWECYARTMTFTAYKYCGTAPVGRDRSDPEAVVDSELR